MPAYIPLKGSASNFTPSFQKGMDAPVGATASGPSWLERQGGRRTGFPVVANTTGLSNLAFQLRTVVSAQELAAVQAELYAIGEDVAETAKENASFSTRIPPSIHVRRTRGLQVRVEAGGPSAPNAWPIENKGKGYVEHPVFGRLPKTKLNSHPAYMKPAEEAHRASMDARVEVALNSAAEKVVAAAQSEYGMTLSGAQGLL